MLSSPVTTDNTSTPPLTSSFGTEATLGQHPGLGIHCLLGVLQVDDAFLFGAIFNYL